MTIRPFPKSALIALALAFFAFFMSALVSRAVFDRLPHLEDEMAYLYQARTIAGGHLVIPSPEPHRAFWQPFLLDQGGQRFGKYTPGWPLQLALGVLMGQPWIINALFAALTVALVYRLGREIFNADVGVIAAALTAFSPMALLLDGTLMGHASALFAATVFLYAYWRIERGKRRLLWGMVAGIALGLLIANRPISGVAIGLPLILWSGVRLVRALLRQIRSRGDSGLPQPIAEVIGTGDYLPVPERMSVSLAESHTPAIPYDVADVEVEDWQPPQPRLPGFFATLSPLIVLSVFTLLLSALVPIYSYLAVGNPTKDLYTLVWSYDQIGFGPCCGRSGHTLAKGINQARFDLSLTAADLFGWQIGSMTASNDDFLAGATTALRGDGLQIAPTPQTDNTLKPDVQDHLLNEGNYWEELGISWILLPFGFLAAYRRKAIFIALWVAGAYGLVRFALDYQGGAQLQNPAFGWAWIAAALIWLYVPLVFWRDQRKAWTWILWSAAVGLVVIQMAYWIGSQRYSTRYFYEGLTGIAIISALPLAWLARRVSRPLVYGLLTLALVYSLYAYSTPRISVLKGYNLISGQQLVDLQARRSGDQPVLVLINGANVAWRAYAAFSSQTSPYLNSDIVAAWNYEGTDGSVKKQILAAFPDRQVIEMNGNGNYAWFGDQQPPPQASG